MDEYQPSDQIRAARIRSGREREEAAGRNNGNHGGEPWPATELGGETQK